MIKGALVDFDKNCRSKFFFLKTSPAAAERKKLVIKTNLWGAPEETGMSCCFFIWLEKEMCKSAWPSLSIGTLSFFYCRKMHPLCPSCCFTPRNPPISSLASISQLINYSSANYVQIVCKTDGNCKISTSL